MTKYKGTNRSTHKILKKFLLIDYRFIDFTANKILQRPNGKPQDNLGKSKKKSQKMEGTWRLWDKSLSELLSTKCFPIRSMNSNGWLYFPPFYQFRIGTTAERSFYQIQSQVLSLITISGPKSNIKSRRGKSNTPPPTIQPME